MIQFTCNICATVNPWDGKPLDREARTCAGCGSSVRTRGLLLALSRELFGAELTLDDFPRLKSLRGLGTSDSRYYADRLATLFDYRNTFYDREPRFDLVNPPAHDAGSYDFVTSSEVLEHVLPPAVDAFRKIASILKPSGVLVFTVPYSLEPSTAEHYPGLTSHALAELDGKTVVVARMQDGLTRVFEDPIFHVGVNGPSLEMREYSEGGLTQVLNDAGFPDVRICGEAYAPFGVAPAETWSLPVVARKAPLALGPEATRELVEQWRTLNQRFQKEMRGFNRSFWFRAGRKLRLF